MVIHFRIVDFLPISLICVQDFVSTHLGPDIVVFLRLFTHESTEFTAGLPVSRHTVWRLFLSIPGVRNTKGSFEHPSLLW